MVNVPGTADPPPQQVTIDPAPMGVTVDIDLTDLRTVMMLAGWPSDKIDLGQAVAQAESGRYSDAVGDISLADNKWGPSIGLFQIRSLRYPLSYSGADLWRYAFALRQPIFNCQAALAITNGGADFSKWSVYTSGAYQPFLGQNPVIRTGHAQSADWTK